VQPVERLVEDVVKVALAGRRRRDIEDQLRAGCGECGRVGAPR
jgi:hypothetical protein